MMRENLRGVDMSAELDLEPAEITWIGKLDGGTPNTKIWRGSIPAPEYQLSQEEIERFKKLLNRYYVPVGINTSVRCIDGRPKNGVLDKDGQANTDILENIRNSPIGPQVPGGTPAAAIAYRIAKFNDRPGGYPQEVLADDLLELARIQQVIDIPFKPGAHFDDRAQYPDTGCKAIDEAPLIMDVMVEPESLVVIKPYTEAILGDSFDEDVYMEVIATLHYMNQPRYKNAYLQKDDELGTDYRDIVLPMVRKVADKQAVEKMVGAHKEFAVGINMRRGETFDRDLMSLEHNNATQLFNYDHWFVEDAARAIFPNDEPARKLLVTSRVMYCIATAMVITNGNLELGIRQ